MGAVVDLENVVYNLLILNFFKKKNKYILGYKSENITELYNIEH